MRSDRDNRTDKELEIDSFLSQFDDPLDELSTDYSSYLSETDTTKLASAQTFNWKDVGEANLSAIGDSAKDEESGSNDEQPAERKKRKKRSSKRSVVSDTDNPAAIMTAEELQKKLSDDSSEGSSESKEPGPSDAAKSKSKRSRNRRRKYSKYRNQDYEHIEDEYLKTEEQLPESRPEYSDDSKTDAKGSKDSSKSEDKSPSDKDKQEAAEVRKRNKRSSRSSRHTRNTAAAAALLSADEAKDIHAEGAKDAALKAAVNAADADSKSASKTKDSKAKAKADDKAKDSEPKSGRKEKDLDPESAKKDKDSKPESDKKDKNSEPKSEQKPGDKDSKPVKSEKDSEPKSDKKDKDSEPKSGKKDKDSEPKSDKKDKDTEPKSEKKDKDSEPRSDKKDKDAKPKSDKKDKDTEPKSDKKDKDSEPKSDKKDKDSEPKSDKKDKDSEPKSDKKDKDADSGSDQKAKDSDSKSEKKSWKELFKPKESKDKGLDEDKDKKKEAAAAAATAGALTAEKSKPAPSKSEGKTSKSAKQKTKKSLAAHLFLKENKDYDPSKGPAYELDGKTIKNKPYKFSFLKLIRDFAFIGFVMVFAFMVYVLVCITQAPKYDFNDVYAVVDTASIVYDDKGKQVDNIFYLENRRIVPYDQMPENLINSFVAIEDKTFWKHHGFNWTRMIGAVLSSILGNGRISGTSTITQQLARNVYLPEEKSVRSIKRKILEMYYASRLERALTKEQIIEAYLNTIYLGHGCYGINSAARTYFSKSVKDLDLVESAALAALPQSPDVYALLKLGSEAQNVADSEVVQTDPETVVTNDLAKGRRQLTLDLMLEQGLISKEDHDKVYDLALNDFIKPSLKSNSSDYSYFHEYLVDTLIADLQEQKGLSFEDAERMVYTGGLQIYSTVDSKAQKTIVKEFQDGSNFPYVTAPRDYDGNMLNNDGQIALYKYENFFDKKGNFKLSGEDGDVKVNDDGSITIMAGKKLHIYETSVDGGTDYSLEFKNYYLYDDNDILYSIQGGYVNVPMNYKSADSNGNVTISAEYFSDPNYTDAIKIDGKNVILTSKSYTLSSRSRQPQAAMTIVGVGTGEVKAMVGGRQFGGKRLLNRAIITRQPGSSIKPLAVYGAALQKSYELAEQGKKWTYTDFKIDRQGTKGWGDYVTTHSSIEDERTRINGKYWPKNANMAFTGKNTFKTAVQKSINTCAVKLQMQVGADYSIEQLKKFGISTVIDDTSQAVNDANSAALALGAMSEGVEPLEMALAYASFPAGGKLNTPICYYKVLDRNGEVLLEGKSKQSESMNEGVAWIMTDVLKSVVNFNRYMYVEGTEPGGKTGTTNDQYDIWFDGFTPTYAAALWIGTDENVEMSSMSTPAAALWGKIINQLPNAKTGEYAKMPSNVIQKGADYYTKGTETGLASWSSKEAREKAKKEAYQKWLKERENHKHQVCDAPTKKCTGGEAIDWEQKEVCDSYIVEDDETKPIYDTEGNIIGYEKKQTCHSHKEYDKSKPIKYSEKKCVEIPGKCHDEYDSGWETFKYKGD